MKQRKIWKNTLYTLTTLSIVAPIIVLASCGKEELTRSRVNTPEEIERTFKNAEKLTLFSKNNKNVVLFWADEVTGVAAYDYLKNQTNGKKVAKDFTGATIYKNVMIPGRSTNQGVPLMYGGWNFTIPQKDRGIYKDVTIEKFNKEAYKTTINLFKEKNYTQQYHQVQWFGHGSNRNFSSNSGEFQKYFNDKTVTATNTAEFLYKYNDKLKFTDEQLEKDENWLDYYGTKTLFENIHVDNTKKPIFKSINTQATHGPYHYLENNKLQKGNSDKATYTVIKQLSNLIKKLKANKVYNNTMIIIASDHGSMQLPQNQQNPEWNPLWKEYKKNRINAIQDQPFRMNPMLIIKPFNAVKSMQFDDTTFLSTADIPQIFANALNSKSIESSSSKSAFFLKNPLNQTQPRSLQMWGSEWPYLPKDKNFVGIRKEKHRITGNYWDFKNWETATYGKNNWTKTFNWTTNPSVNSDPIKIQSWDNFNSQWNNEFGKQIQDLKSQPKAARLLEPKMLNFINYWKQKAKSNNLKFDINIPHDFDTKTQSGAHYLGDTLIWLENWIKNNQTSALFNILEVDELKIENYLTNPILNKAWIKFYHNLNTKFNEEIQRQSGDFKKAARIIEPKFLKFIDMWKQKAQAHNVPFDVKIPINYSDPTSSDWIGGTIQFLDKWIDNEKASNIFNVLNSNDLDIEQYIK